MVGIDLGKRSAKDWCFRVLFAALVCLIGYCTVMQSLAMAMATRRIELAYSLAPFDARLTAELSRHRLGDLTTKLASRQLSSTAFEDQLAVPERLARQALRRDPTAVVAADTLGVIEQLRGSDQTAQRLHLYSEQMSRRDLPTQIWMIEDAVARQDIPRALRHYDTALRTKWGSWDLLVPILAQASVDPAIRSELVKLLATRPAWAENFVNFLAINGSDPVATAQMFQALGRARVSVPQEAQASVVNKLIATKRFDAAWSYYASVRPGAERQRTRDPNFIAMLDHPSQLDWTLATGDTGLTASIQRNGNGALFDFFAPSSVGGTLIYQIQLLPPGRYMLEGQSVGISQPRDSLPYWILTCTSDGRELGRSTVTNSIERSGMFGGPITVPMGCPAQYLALIARTSSGQEGLSGQIARVQLRPLQ